MANTHINIADSPDARADWELAGEACAHAAIDWASRVLRPSGSIAITFWGPGHELDLRNFFIVIGKPATSEAVR
jgi:hypothetical protein